MQHDEYPDMPLSYLIGDIIDTIMTEPVWKVALVSCLCGAFLDILFRTAQAAIRHI